MNKILVPVDFPNPFLRALHQAAFLARHFHSEIILLHVVTPFSYPAGMLERGHEITVRDLQDEIVRQAQNDLDLLVGPELDGLAVKRLLLRGDPAREIARTANDEKVELIVMSTHSYGAFYGFLLGSVTAKVLNNSACPVWTGRYMKEAPTREFAIRRVLCAVDLRPNSSYTLSQAAQVAADFGARLTIVHITDSVEIYGPGGFHVVPEFKDALVGHATKEIANLQHDAGTQAEVIIDSGSNVHKLLNRTAEQTNSDLLVIGHLPYSGRLGVSGCGYAIVSESQIPVLSV